MRAHRGKASNHVDHNAPPAGYWQLIVERARALAEESDRPADAAGVPLPPLERRADECGYRYPWVEVDIAPDGRTATVTVSGPPPVGLPKELAAIVAAGARWWPLAMARELDDAILMLRANHREIGTLMLKTRGEVEALLASDESILANRQYWFVRETEGLLRRTLQRLDVSSRSLFAVIDEGSCFAGSLFELALAADRSYMLADASRIALSALNFGGLEMVNGRTRLATRFNDQRGAASLRALA